MTPRYLGDCPECGGPVLPARIVDGHAVWIDGDAEVCACGTRVYVSADVDGAHVCEAVL
jgi:uncharacterized Zn-binding protein involved in type VI secretion